MLSFVKTKFGLILLSSIISAVLFIGVYEVIKNIQYYRWKENFDNSGWLGKVTIPSPNPVLMWEYRPYSEFKGIRTNRYGFRDTDYDSTAKSDNDFRIAFAGDSVTLGMGVNQEATFVRKFEIAANRKDSRYHRIQALNFGVDGYSTPQIYEMIRTKVLQFSPDKVVYMMCLNDFDFSLSSGKKNLYFKKPASFLVSNIEMAYLRLYGGEFHQYFFRKNKQVVFQNILDMNRLLDEKGISFQVVIVPVFPATFDNYPLQGMVKEIAMFLKENGIQVFDLHEAFYESGESPGFYASDIWHPNVKGHRFIARQLLPSVLLE